MPENPTEPTEPHDIRTIRQLVRLMKRYDLTAVDFVEGGTQIRLRRRGPEGVATATAAPTFAPALTPQPPTAPAPAPPSPASNEVVIESPMVGTYYASPAPESPPFVSVGATVRPDTTVCVIEAMKVFTDIDAGVSGTVTDVLVKNGQPVEFGQPLFRVKPS